MKPAVLLRLCLLGIAACASQRTAGTSGPPAPPATPALPEASASPRPQAPPSSASAPADRPPTAPDVRAPLEQRPFAQFASQDLACKAIYDRVHFTTAETKAVACAPFETRTTCHLVRAPQGATLLEVEIIETVPTEHCANHPNAPRARVKSTTLAPVTSSPPGLRVGIESLVDAPHTATMSEGLHDGDASLDLVRGLDGSADGEHVLVFSTQSSSCQRYFMVCDRAFAWCTEATSLRLRRLGDATCEDTGDVSSLQFAREGNHLRITTGDAARRTVLYPLFPAKQTAR